MSCVFQEEALQIYCVTVSLLNCAVARAGAVRLPRTPSSHGCCCRAWRRARRCRRRARRQPDLGPDATRSGQAPGARPQHATHAAPPLGLGSNKGSLAAPDAPPAVMLAVYAPRLGRVDVYPARQGSRVASVRTRGGPACLLPAGALFGLGSPLAAGGAARRDAGALAGSGSGLGDERAGACWMLECASGELWSVDAAVAAALGGAGLRV